MTIEIRHASLFEQHQEWNGTEYDTYNVVDDFGKVICNFESMEEAQNYIREQTPDSDWFSDR